MSLGEDLRGATSDTSSHWQYGRLGETVVVTATDGASPPRIADEVPATGCTPIFDTVMAEFGDPAVPVTGKARPGMHLATLACMGAKNPKARRY